jgi:hypothetical protein
MVANGGGGGDDEEEDEEDVDDAVADVVARRSTYRSAGQTSDIGPTRSESAKA